MKVACVGGGPAGLYFAISMKLRNPGHDITVFERNAPGATYGWGVVFSDQTMEHLEANDPQSAQTMIDELAHWDDIEVHLEDGPRKVTTRSSGHGFIGIGRKRLLNILQDRARELGVRLEFEIEVEPDSDFLGEFDLVIASDGLNSRLRRRYDANFKTDIDVKRNRFVWLGTHQHFDAFNFIFKNTRFGRMWAHAYQFSKDTATFIVECSPETFERAGFESLSQAQSCRLCEDIFADHLGGHELMSNAGHIRGSAWI
ncbi:MAG TPA: FAD-dependent monooxygenase, partial [Sphingomicrobium sp.]|nr:FAD-dependent monooxygenase [Sphingomicrobium sp.]